MKWLMLPLLLLLVSCGAAVVSDYDTTTDFSKYQTYNFYGSIDSGLNDLDDKRILRITDSILTLKGFRKVEHPQLLINFYAKEVVTSSRNTIGIGIGGGGRNMGVGVSGGIPIGGNDIEQKFTFDVIDALDDKLIWQGVLEKRFKENSTPNQKELYYGRLLSSILDKFPPRK